MTAERFVGWFVLAIGVVTIVVALGRWKHNA